MCHTLDNVVNVKENCRYSGDSSVRSLARLFWGLLFVIFHNNICTYNYSELQHDVQYKYSDTIYYTGLWIIHYPMWFRQKVIHKYLLCAVLWGQISWSWLKCSRRGDQIPEMGWQMDLFLLRSSLIWALFDAHYVYFECFWSDFYEIVSLSQQGSHLSLSCRYVLAYQLINSLIISVLFSILTVHAFFLSKF